MKLPQQVRPEMFDQASNFIRSQAESASNAGVSAQGMCDYPGLSCGPCNNGSRQCTFPGSRSQFPCPC